MCLLAACGGDGGGKQITLRLMRDGAALAGEEVEVWPEHPPGGRLKRKADAEGRVRVPSSLAGVRVLVGTACGPKGTCEEFSRPHRLDADELTFDVRDFR